MMRYLQATRFNYAKTHEAIMKHYTWYTTVHPSLPPSREALDMIEAGFMYLHRRDQRGRCIVVCDVPRITHMLSDDMTVLPRAVEFLLTYFIEKCAVPGRAETWNMIIDLNGLGMT